MFNTTGVLLIQTQEIFFKNTGLKKKELVIVRKQQFLGYTWSTGGTGKGNGKQTAISTFGNTFYSLT